jgi:hypothetical protein
MVITSPINHYDNGEFAFEVGTRKRRWRVIAKMVEV